MQSSSKRGGVHVQRGTKYPDGGRVWVSVPTVTGVRDHPFTVASSAADPAWANCMLLQCESKEPWAHVCITTAPVVATTTSYEVAG